MTDRVLLANPAAHSYCLVTTIEDTLMPGEVIRKDTEARRGDIWPGQDYHAQIKKLRALVGQQIHIVEIRPTSINAGVAIEGKSFELVDVLEFTRPDAQRNLLPHMIVLGDGRGINLGRIARISTDTAFDPAIQNTVYSSETLLQHHLYRPRKIAFPGFIKKLTRHYLGMMLGRPKRQTVLEIEETLRKGYLEEKSPDSGK